MVLSDNLYSDVEPHSNIPRLRKTAKEFIKWISPSVSSVEQIVRSKMVQARLSLDFMKPKDMTDEDYKRSLGAVLAPISELGSVKFVLSSGLKLNGNTLVYVVPRTIRTDVINTQSYIDEMLDVYNEIPGL